MSTSHFIFQAISMCAQYRHRALSAVQGIAIIVPDAFASLHTSILKTSQHIASVARDIADAIVPCPAVPATLS